MSHLAGSLRLEYRSAGSLRRRLFEGFSIDHFEGSNRQTIAFDGNWRQSECSRGECAESANGCGALHHESRTLIRDEVDKVQNEHNDSTSLERVKDLECMDLVW